MQSTPVIAVFDIGKTNKKLFLFDASYRIVYEESACFAETIDEDGDACEDLDRLQDFVFVSLKKVFEMKAFELKALNFSAYGASFVHLDEAGRPVCPLYNYLKKYPEDLLRQFYDAYGGMDSFAVATASPVMGFLNSGMQLFWLKYRKPQVFKKIHSSLHLPQYLSFLVSGNLFSELTSIGCHTNLWDYTKSRYHDWVAREGILPNLAPLVPSTLVVYSSERNSNYRVGVGLHDSSASLIPYQATFSEPFVLISTGTWCVSLNPFNHAPLTYSRLQQDCLCFLSYEGKSVMASRLFAGNEHDQQVKKLAMHFGKLPDYYKTVSVDPSLLQQLERRFPGSREQTVVPLQQSAFTQRSVFLFGSYEEAYHQLMQDIVLQQAAATRLVLEGSDVRRIYVDGGFAANELFMHLLATAFPEMEVFAASMAQASAMGAALAIHDCWNNNALPGDLLQLKAYSAAKTQPAGKTMMRE